MDLTIQNSCQIHFSEENMSNPYFKFKRFTVFHDKCAMKVGTDGVLLGAWADVEGAGRILDVGTGTGLIALMTAQRNPSARIFAIDIDAAAISQAEKNIRESPFSAQISVLEADFRHFASSAGQQFDALVCNPPFFENSLKPTVLQRSIARHSESLPMEELLGGAKKLLSARGSLSLVLPSDKLSKTEAVCEGLSLHIVRKTIVKPLPDSLPKRVLLEISPCFKSLAEDEITLENSRHEHSDEYNQLTRDFYLKL
ncbi:MAG: methyltransferase [Dysgonamonadaceae bacterium]|nr:methyltransferase [Dysgonamonadaceae bacterium]